MKAKIIGLVIFLLVDVIVWAWIISVGHNYNQQVAEFNNGVCEKCGTEFHLFDIETMRNYSTKYYYVCKNEHILKCDFPIEKN